MPSQRRLDLGVGGDGELYGRRSWACLSPKQTAPNVRGRVYTELQVGLGNL